MTDKQWEPPETAVKKSAKAILRPKDYKWKNLTPGQREAHREAAHSALLASPLPECVGDMQALITLVEYLNGQIQAIEDPKAWPSLEELHGNDLIEFREIKARLAKLEGKEPVDETY